MRELKFRVWDTQNKCYVENKNGGIEWSIWELEHLGEYKDRVIIEQYTDEYDVNDKEIAEGDIVQYVSANEEALVQATVKYGYPYGYNNDDGTLFVKGFFYDDCKIDDFVDLTEEEYDGLGGTKIIGNIHENAGLLESMARTKREDAEDAPYRNAKLSNWKPEAHEPTFRDGIERKTPKGPIDRDKLNSIIADLNKTDDQDICTIHVNLGDTDAIKAVCEMLNSGVKGRNVNIDVRTINGQVISTPHEEEDGTRNTTDH